MKYNYFFAPFFFLITSSCSDNEVATINRKPIAQLTIEQERTEPNWFITNDQHQYQTVYVQDQLQQIDLDLESETCLFENGAWDCNTNRSEETNQFSYTDGNINGFEHVASTVTPDISARFENGQLLSITEIIQNRAHTTSYTYEGDKVVRIESGLAQFSNNTWEKTLTYEGNNLTKIQVDLLAFQSSEEWIITYDQAVNPFYQHEEWLLTLKIGLDNWRQAIAAEALLFSENNVSTISIKYTNANGSESFESYTFDRTYDDDNHPIETTIMRNNSQNPRFQQTLTYAE